MLLVEDKHDTYVIDNDNGDEWAALNLVRRRLEEGYWYYNYDEGDPSTQYQDRARKIVEDEDATGALDFLMERREHEYEWVEQKQAQKE